MKPKRGLLRSPFTKWIGEIAGSLAIPIAICGPALAGSLLGVVRLLGICTPPQGQPMPGDLTILYRSTDQSPLGQIMDAAYIRNSTGIPKHRVLGSYALIFLIGGGGTYSDTNHKPVPVSAGDLFILFPDVAHRYGPARNGKWDEFYILFHGPAFDLWRKAGILSPKRPLFRLGPVEPWLSKLTNVLDVSTASPSDRQIVMTSRLQAVLAEIITTQLIAMESGAQQWLTEAQHWLEAELAEEMDPHWVATQVGFSYDHFRRKFTKETGMTPYQYRSTQRLRAAQKMLIETEMSLKEIAAAVGYYDAFAFSHRFKQFAGLSPSAFRQEASTP